MRKFRKSIINFDVYVTQRPFSRTKQHNPIGQVQASELELAKTYANVKFPAAGNLTLIVRN